MPHKWSENRGYEPKGRIKGKRYLRYGISGGRGHGGYKIFQVLAVLSKRPVRIETGSKVVGSMEVYLKEPSSKEKEEFEMLKTISAR